jgi:hypothetical protein
LNHERTYERVGCVPRTHRLIGVIACLPVGRGITPYKVVKELNAFVLIYKVYSLTVWIMVLRQEAGKLQPFETGITGFTLFTFDHRYLYPLEKVIRLEIKDGGWPENRQGGKPDGCKESRTQKGCS